LKLKIGTQQKKHGKDYRKAEDGDKKDEKKVFMRVDFLVQFL
jgi:hypothetical protein